MFDTVDASPLTAAGQWPLDGSSSVPQATTVGAVLSKAVTASSVQLTLTANGDAVAGTTAYDAATRKVTFTPAAALAPWHHLHRDARRHGSGRRTADHRRDLVLHDRARRRHRGAAPAASTTTRVPGIQEIRDVCR